MKKCLFTTIFLINILQVCGQGIDSWGYINGLRLDVLQSQYHEYFYKKRNDTMLWSKMLSNCDSLIKNDTFIYKAIGLHYKGLIHMFKDTARARALFFESIKVNPEIFDNYFKITVLDEQLYGYGRASAQRVKIWQTAVQNYKQLLSEDSSKALLWFNYGKSLKQYGVYGKNKKLKDSGLKYIRHAACLDSMQADYWFEIGIDSKQSDSIVYYLMKTFNLTSNKEGIALVIYNQLINKNKDYEKTRQLIDKWREDYPDNEYYLAILEKKKPTK